MNDAVLTVCLPLKGVFQFSLQDTLGDYFQPASALISELWHFRNTALLVQHFSCYTMVTTGSIMNRPYIEFGSQAI
ncbi:MAG: hypothetical protein ABJB66_01525 [Gemmatimonadaceae bacterium]